MKVKILIINIKSEILLIFLEIFIFYLLSSVLHPQINLKSIVNEDYKTVLWRMKKLTLITISID